MAPESQSSPSRRQVLGGIAAIGVGVTVGGGLLTACGGGTASGGKRAQQLFVAGFQWSPPTTFNPLDPTAAWPAGENNMQLLYEALFGFDLLDGSLKPILGKDITQPDDKTMVVTLQADAKWQDGQPVTADDVVYTFGLGKTHPEVPFSSFWQYVKTLEATDTHTVTFGLDPKSPNPGMVKALICQNYILPKHLWTDIEAQNKTITKFTNLKPVGSGPYKLQAYNSSQLNYQRDDNYWGKSIHGGKLPAPKYIVHPIFKDNAAGNLAFERGEVDVMQQFTPEIWKMWQSKHEPIATWYDKVPYQVPGSIPMLVMNTTKKGLNNPKVRLALAYSIDYARIAETAMSKYSVPANSSVILPQGAESQYYDKDNVSKYGWKYDPAKAKDILENELHATKGSDGVYKLPDGTRLGPWTAQTPTGWSDWQTALQVVSENAKSAGFDISTQFPQAAETTTNVQNGNFDLACWYVTGVSASSPWQRFRDVLDNRGVPAPGKSAFYNYGRFSNAQVPALLDSAATLTGSQAKAVFTQLDTIFMQNVPMIPLMYRPLDFYEFNKTTWSGFPTDAHPSAPPQFSGAGVYWLYGLTPTKK